MERNLVQIARIRTREVTPGDVVNRMADDPRGWFSVGTVEELFDGDFAISNDDRTKNFSAGPFDIVGVQMLKPLDIPALENAEPDSEQEDDQEGGGSTAEVQSADEQDAEHSEPAAQRTQEPTPDPARVAEVSRAKEALAARISKG